MQLLTNHQNERCRRWCVLVVMVAVCALTVHVSTRYCSFDSSSYTVKTLHKRSLETNRHRLTKNAANWAPPLVDASALGLPTSYSRIAPAESSIPTLSFDKSLYD